LQKDVLSPFQRLEPDDIKISISKSPDVGEGIDRSELKIMSLG